MFYTATDWYWIIGGDTSKVYASKRVAYIPPDDSEYQAWIDGGGFTTMIDTADSLFDVLVQQWLPSYLSTGVQIESTGVPSLNGTYPADPTTQSQVSGIAASLAAGLTLPGGGTDFVYQGRSFDAGHFLQFAQAMSNWTYNVYRYLHQIVTTGSGALPSQPVTIP